MYTVYGRDNCPHCVNAKELLESKGLDYEYKKVGEDVTIDQLRALCPVPIGTVPQIFLVLDDQQAYIGGFDKLKQHFSQ